MKDEYLVCPHCGGVDYDSWEVDFGPGLEGDATLTCGSCEKDYFASRHVTVYYITEKVKDYLPSRQVSVDYTTSKVKDE